MINEYSLIELLKKYDVNPENIKGYKMDRLITYSEYEEVEKVLKYLRNTLNIKPSRIEKCPSILYFGCENIIDNYNFLESNGFNVLKLNDCLHILNCNNELLEETYEYVVKKYGEKLLLKNPSILSVPVLVIRRVEDVSQGRLSKKGILSVAAYINYENEINLSTNELREILDICELMDQMLKMVVVYLEESQKK